MRISNDGYINNTNDRLKQVNKESKVKNKVVQNSQSNEKLDSIAASVRETNSSMMRVQSELTRNQIASDGLVNLREALMNYSNAEMNSTNTGKISEIIRNAVESTRFNGEQVLNEIGVNAQEIRNSEDFNKFMKLVESKIDSIQKSISSQTQELNKLSLSYQNQVSAMSSNQVSNVSENVKSVIQNLSQVLNAQSNIQNEQVNNLIN